MLLLSVRARWRHDSLQPHTDGHIPVFFVGVAGIELDQRKLGSSHASGGRVGKAVERGIAHCRRVPQRSRQIGFRLLGRGIHRFLLASRHRAEARLCVGDMGDQLAE